MFRIVLLLSPISHVSYTSKCLRTAFLDSFSFHVHFRAWEHSQGLGCTFAVKANSTHGSNFSTALSPQSWRENVETGFQMLPTSLQGRIDGNDGSLGSVRDGIPGTCSWDITIQPKCGWGNVNQPQKSTAGWLAKYPVFEPHWQVTLADATASGIVIWKNKTFHFREEPFYAEKNWGGQFHFAHDIMLTYWMRVPVQPDINLTSLPSCPSTRFFSYQMVLGSVQCI